MRQILHDALPIDAELPRILAAFETGNRLILAAPPGAGKTTRVPLALAGLLGKPGLLDGRILMLEPRRVAARMAAERMAQSLGERLGETIGLSTRLGRHVSSKTRIEVITDGLFTRRILSDPALEGVDAVLFDEFHERRLNADLGLALALDVQAALREDLRVAVMSATLDTARTAGAIGAPVIESAGRQFPVQTIYLGRSGDPLEQRVARVIRQALRDNEGSILVFLPGAREINRVIQNLTGQETDALVLPLYGALPPGAQDEAVVPPRPGVRKVVLATDIAESSLTIEGVRIVIDAGLSRIAEETADGLGSRLLTVVASRASVDQRRGRAGRTAPGLCYRLWDEEATRGLPAAPMPEILTADLSGLALALAEWGEQDPERLTWMDTPPPGRLEGARAMLRELGALEAGGRLAPLGHELSRLPLNPRLGALIVRAQHPGERALAAEIAALLSERGIGGDSTDLNERLIRFRADRSPRARQLRQQASRWGGGATAEGDLARILVQAWPGAVARRRPGSDSAYLMASGRAAILPASDRLAQNEWLAIADLGGAAKDPRILLAAPLNEAVALASGQVVTEDTARYDTKSKRVAARRVRRLGAILLSETPLPRPDAALAARALLGAVEEEGLGVIGAERVAEETLNRVRLLAESGRMDRSALTPESLRAQMAVWLLPLLERLGGALPPDAAIRESLLASLDWETQTLIRREAPLKLDLPSGQTVQVDWCDPRAPLVSARVQALYGLSDHPHLAGGSLPVSIELLSPAMKPVASTRDIGAFWNAGYRDMVKDMRGRYPKHDWPEDPARAIAHAGRTKNRLGAGKGRP